MGFFRKKSLESIREVGASSGLSKNLTAFDLILLGLGAIIGTGVFVLTGLVAAEYSGPAVTLSYTIAGITCIFVALSYSELATMIPTSGSVYTYSYIAFGEIFAWMMGSVMILECGFAAATVAAGWSAYVQRLLRLANISLPTSLTTVPQDGGILNLPALVIVCFIGFILYLGTKDSKKLNALLVLIKALAIFAFIVCAIPHFDASHWDNFMPFGFDNVVVGSSVLFFAFTGFGSLATAAEECKNPKRDLMIGIIGSLVLSTLVYVLVAGLLTGITSFDQLGNTEALAHALMINNSHFGSVIVATGAVCGMTTVLLMNLYSLSRVFYVISRDGLLPKSFSKIHPKYDSPYMTIMIFSIFAAILSSMFPIQNLAALSSMGALLNYIMVTIIVMLFRFRMPNIARPFKCPILFVIGPSALVSCMYLLFKLIIKDGQLLTGGKFLVGWLCAVLSLYIFRHFFVKKIS